MQQFSVDVFDRSLTYVCNGLTSVSSIDDDYISPKTNIITIPKVSESIIAGYFIRLQNEKFNFFGVITDVSPGEFETTIQFSSFISIFRETILFYLGYQGTEAGHSVTLEDRIRAYIAAYYVNHADTYVRLPLRVYVDPNITQTNRWYVGIISNKEGFNYATPDIYTDLIVPALKKYGVAIVVTPDFNAKRINLKITKSSKTLNIDGNLDNVTVRALKYNDRPLGANRLTLVNGNNANQQITYYVHPDRTFDTNNTNRITPVAFETRIVNPSENTQAAFQAAALDEAYNVFSGNSWDNLIELEVDPDDENIQPMELEIGQKITLWYNGASYTSILTGRIIEESCIVLLFGSERIEYTKRTKGGR